MSILFIMDILKRHTSDFKYGMMNYNNLFNFMISTLNELPIDQKVKMIESMKLNLGMTFTDYLKNYIFKKFPSSDLLKLF